MGEVQPGMAKCMKECTPGKDGTCLHHTVPMKASKKSDISYSANTLFCWAFYTKKTGSWINSNIFIAAWKAIKDEGVWASKDWTVKVDADAVFLPTRLRDYLGKVEVTENGIYLENCKYVSYGFFGSLEVLSHGAAS